MSIGAKMLTDWQKPFGGKVAGATLPCAIVRKNAKSLPFQYCNASWWSEDAGQREYLTGVAEYSPHKEAEFSFWVEPFRDSENGLPGSGDVRIRDGVLRDQADPYSLLWRRARLARETLWNTGDYKELQKGWAIMVPKPQAHCERLAFWSNLSPRIDAAKTPWFGPGLPGDSGNSSSPPLSASKTMWRRAASFNFNPSLVKGSGDDAGSKVNQGFAMNDSGVPKPDFDDSYRAAATWAWAPSRLRREGDTLSTYEIGGTQQASGRTYRWELGGDKVGHLVDSWTVKLERGKYDWRFFNSLIRRRKWSRGIGYARQFTEDHFPLWWDLNRNCGTPHGLSNEDALATVILKYAYHLDDPEGPYIPTYPSQKMEMHTYFDVKIQACVFSVRLGSAIVKAIAGEGWNLLKLADSSNGTHVGRYWEHTQYYVSIRRAMPVMAPL